MNEYNPEAIKNLPYIKHGSIYFTEFGKIIEVNNGEEFVALRSEFGQEIYMRKWYWGWGKVFRRKDALRQSRSNNQLGPETQGWVPLGHLVVHMPGTAQ